MSYRNGTKLLFERLLPLIRKEIKDNTQSFCRTFSMVVVDSYDEGTKKVGVAEAFGTTIYIPVCGIVDTSKLTVGTTVWVFAPHSSMSNAMVFMLGDGSV